jgi:hypothetical protein
VVFGLKHLIGLWGNRLLKGFKGAFVLLFNFGELFLQLGDLFLQIVVASDQ